MPKEKAKQEKKQKQKIRFEKSAGAIIFYIEKGKPLYLLLKYPTYWGFAKGLIEKGESAEQTAQREIKEEAGLEVEFVPGFKETQKWWYRFKGQLVRKEAIFLLAKASTKEVKLSAEHEDYKWCTFEQAIALLKKIKANVALLESIHKFLQGHLRQKRLF